MKRVIILICIPIQRFNTSVVNCVSYNIVTNVTCKPKTTIIFVNIQTINKKQKHDNFSYYKNKNSLKP